MSLISKDFRLNQPAIRNGRTIRLRWALLTIVFIGIGVVIAGTNTQSRDTANHTEIIAGDVALPAKDMANIDDEPSRERISLTLPKLQNNITQKPKPQKQRQTQPVRTQSAPQTSTQIQLTPQTIDNADKIAVEIPAIQPGTPVSTPSAVPAERQWRDFKVKPGDSLARLFNRANIKPQQLDELMKSGDAVKTLRKIFPKDIIRIATDDSGMLQALHYDIGHDSYLLVERNGGVLAAEKRSHHVEARQAHASGVISSSLFLAAQDAGISQNIIMELASIFAWDIDFALDIRQGDSFTVLYEELFRDGEKISYGNILAAEFINNGETHRAVRYTNPQTNKSEFFTPDGKSMRKAFLRTPLNFSRISSRFNPNRRHPVLNTIRAHKGVDYAAKTGTPVFSSGDGKVIFKGVKGGYGKTVIVQHGTKYSTLYAHLNSYNRKIRVGSKVKQGQTIAYVGSTGLSTGPHLHYEFRVNGVHRNPLTVKLPESNPVPKRYMVDFELTTTPVFAQLDLVSRTVQLALTDIEQ